MNTAIDTDNRNLGEMISYLEARIEALVKRNHELESANLQLRQDLHDRQCVSEYLQQPDDRNAVPSKTIDSTEQETSLKEFPCAGCGMVYPGHPSHEPWACDKCLH